MRHITGAVRGAALQELQADPEVDIHAENGLTVAVVHHTAGSLSARTLLGQYREHGLAAVERRSEDCAVVLVDEGGRMIVLARDFVGATPLYYSAAKADFAFATRIVPVLTSLGLERAPDRNALVSHLVYRRGPWPGQTWFENVASVPPGRVVIRHEDGSTVVSSPDPPPATGRWTFADAAAEFGRLLRQAVSRRVAANGRTAVFVSGGLDSSALLCLAASGGDVIGINYGVADDVAADETRYLAVLRAAGLRIEHVPFLPMIDAAAAEQSVRDSESPMFDAVPLTLARAATRAVQLDAGAVLIGTWGDQVLSPFPPAHHRTLMPWRIRKLARAYHAYMTDVPIADIARALRRQALRHHAPQPVLQRRRDRLARHSLFDTLAQSVGMFGPIERTRSYHDAVILNVFGPDVQQGIEMTAKWGGAHGLDARLPFLDRELLQFLLTLPDEIAYHDHTLKPLLRASMKGIVPDTVIERRDKGDYTALMRRNSLPMRTVLELLDGLRRPVKHDIMSAAAARRALARIERAHDIGSATDEVSLLLGLDIWLRLFFEK